MDYQLKKGGHLPVMYNWLYDLSRYALGVLGIYWEVEERITSQIVSEPQTLMGIPVTGEKITTKVTKNIGYMGNKLFNVRPYDFYPDPRVPIWRFQDGEFCVRDTSEGYHEIIASEHTFPGYYTNLEEMVRAMKEGEANNTEGTPRIELPIQPGESGKIPGPGSVKITDAYIKLIPKVWGLGESGRVEIWCFQMAEGKIIISAKPLGCLHSKFPFVIAEGNFGSEEFAKTGMVEVMRPLTDVLTWLFNSHFYNVRRVLNNQVVIDPSKIVVKDLTKPGQRIIRLKPSAYGTPPSQVIHQLTHMDVTAHHLSDSQYIEQMIQRVTSVVDNVMGMPQQGGRRSATEARQTAGWSTSRLRTPVEYNSALALDPLSQIMLSNTQQFMSMERKYAVTGNTSEAAERFILATPDAIAGGYDFVPIDGTQPIDRLAQANFWKELLMQMSRSPQLMMEWNLSDMIEHTMKLQGERNVNRFRIQPRIAAPGMDLPGQAAAGNVVPLQGAQGGRGRQVGAAGGGRPAGSSGGTL
jgi:hypothetical protein